MGRALRDFMTGSVLVVGGIIAGVTLLILLSLAGFIMHILALLASMLFSVAIILFCIWMVGYVYRKAREKRIK
jgi:hypothetical protein